MPSALDVAKRALVRLLIALAAKYGVQVTVPRDSADKEVFKPWRKVSLKVHPDKGGDATDFAQLSAANDNWQSASTATRHRGRDQLLM